MSKNLANELTVVVCRCQTENLTELMKSIFYNLVQKNSLYNLIVLTRPQNIENQNSKEYPFTFEQVVQNIKNEIKDYCDFDKQVTEYDISNRIDNFYFTSIEDTQDEKVWKENLSNIIKAFQDDLYNKFLDNCKYAKSVDDEDGKFLDNWQTLYSKIYIDNDIQIKREWTDDYHDLMELSDDFKEKERYKNIKKTEETNKNIDNKIKQEYYNIYKKSITDVNTNANIGVVVCRCQTKELSQYMINIFDSLLAKNYELNIIVLGRTYHNMLTKNNPYPVELIKNNIQRIYGDKFVILTIEDKNDDICWSNNLVKLLNDYLFNEYLDNCEKTDSINRLNTNGINIYGDTEKCLKRFYVDRKYNTIFAFDIKVLEKGSFNLNTDFNNLIKNNTEQSIYDAGIKVGINLVFKEKYDSVYPTVDCCIFKDKTYTQVYMAKKPGESYYRFIGGFADPKDDNFEMSAIREAKEETLLDCEVISYITSQKIDDWRYRNENDKIITTFFALIPKDPNAEPVPSDDIDNITLVNIADLNESNMMKEHLPLLYALQKWIVK